MPLATKFSSVLFNGLKLRCPRCGEGKLFTRLDTLVVRCEKCALPIRARESDTWFFMYTSTAFITGLFIIVMLLIMPQKIWLGRIVIALGAVAVFVLTMPFRKGLAIAIEYWIDSHTEHPKNP